MDSRMGGTPLTFSPHKFSPNKTPACHGASNGGVGALRIIDPKDLVVGLDEEEQLQDLEGILGAPAHGSPPGIPVLKLRLIAETLTSRLQTVQSHMG